jgi:uncharacterized protein (DUF2147 family)
VRADAAVALGLLLAAVAALVAPAWGTSAPAGGDEIRGLWVDNRDGHKRRVAVWIDDCGGNLCGRIYWLRKPLTAGGKPKRDQHNPDVALRERPLCGLTILSDFRPEKQRTWNSGRIYNPNDGRTYSSTMVLQDDGTLAVRGFVGIAAFGKSVEWVRPREPLDRCS